MKRIMKKLIIISVLFLGIFADGNTQINFSMGGGYFASSITTTGFLLEVELEKVYSEKFSIPMQLHAGVYIDKEGNNVLFADLHRGYRLTFQNGLFIEQSFGMGAMLSFYKEYPYYEAENGNAGFFPSGRGWDLLPSVTLGAGYKIPWNNGASGRIWCRPKIYWKMSFDKPSQPKFALQLGYSHVIK
jgi:hypothetical protein